MLLVILLVASPYNLSERKTEEVANCHLPVKSCLSRAIKGRPPDHSTLAKF